MTTFAKPMCARCHKPVERFERDDDEFMGRCVFTAICHGERERVTLTTDEMNRIGSLDFGEAFVPPKLLGSRA